MFSPIRQLSNMTEINEMNLVIDPAIRNWVFIPIVIITFAVGLLRYYCVVLLVPGETPDLAKIQDNHVLMRARLLSRNGKYLPQNSFLMRKDFFTNEENGYLTQKIITQETLSVQVTMMHTFQTRIIELLPMIIVGNLIEKLLSGFVVAKIPFPVTFNFKKFLQPEIFVQAIDNCWISSLAWYILNLAGLNNMCKLVYGEYMGNGGNDEYIVNNQPITYKDVKEELINLDYYNYLQESYEEFEKEILACMPDTEKGAEGEKN